MSPVERAIDLIGGEQEAAWFQALIVTLEHAHGEENALTLQALTELAGIPDRRRTEHLIEQRLQDFPWVIVSSCHGYFRPVRAAEINAYRNSLRSRALKNFLRAKVVARKARAEAWPREGSAFVDVYRKQPDLPLAV